jgi:CubicO group peptidase (beta-lactamase class C family)
MTKHTVAGMAATAMLAVLTIAPAACAAPPLPVAAEVRQTSPEMSDLLAYVQNHNSTGFVVIQDGKVLIDETWPAPTGDAMFANFIYGRTADGALLEDVASQQKSFVALLVAVAIDKGLLDIQQPVSATAGQRPRPTRKRRSRSSTS